MAEDIRDPVVSKMWSEATVVATAEMKVQAVTQAIAVGFAHECIGVIDGTDQMTGEACKLLVLFDPVCMLVMARLVIGHDDLVRYIPNGSHPVPEEVTRAMLGRNLGK